MCDQPNDLFPSIHCMASLFCWIGVRGNYHIPRWYQYLSLIFAIAICITVRCRRSGSHSPKPRFAAHFAPRFMGRILRNHGLRPTLRFDLWAAFSEIMVCGPLCASICGPHSHKSWFAAHSALRFVGRILRNHGLRPTSRFDLHVGGPLRASIFMSAAHFALRSSCRWKCGQPRTRPAAGPFAIEKDRLGGPFTIMVFTSP